MPVTNILKAAQAPAKDRVARYEARLDAHLVTLREDQRCGFLDRELAKWQENYRAWAASVDNGTASERELTYTAWDFTLTIAAIDQRRGNQPAAVTP